MKTRIYCRDVSGKLNKFDVAQKITHKQALDGLKQSKFKYVGAVLLTYFNESVV